MGELCGSYLASMIKNKRNTKLLLIISIFIGQIGGFVYGTAGLLSFSYGPYSVLVGRVLQGIWTGMEQYTEIRYISDNVNLPKNSNVCCICYNCDYHCLLAFGQMQQLKLYSLADCKSEYVFCCLPFRQF